jgi:multidrug efflux system outer membrane protein
MKKRTHIASLPLPAIGVARAAMFPALCIGAGGGVADAVRDIGTYSAHSWALGALL